jgi:PAS domain S-box-containing protein
MLPEERPGPVAGHTEGEVLYANEAFLSLVGTDSREEVVSSSLFDLFDGEERAPLADQFERIAAGAETTLGHSVTVDAANAEPQEVVVVSSRVEWEGETRLQSVFLPASDDALSAAGLRDRAIQEAPIGITIADTTREDEPLIYVNDGFLELTGYPREEVIGRNCRFLQGEATRDEPVARMRSALENEEAVTVTLRNYRRDGTMFWNRVSLSPIETEDGDVTHYLGFQEDVSEAKLYEQEKTLFEQQAEATEQAILITDHNGEIEYVNPAFERLTGYASEEVIGETPAMIKSGQQGPEFYRELWETLEAGETWEATLWNRTKSGELFQAEQTIIPITDDRGEITHFAAVERDVTDELLTEQILDVLNRVLRHNLRSSINVIEGYTEVLSTELENPEQQAIVETINERAAALEKISQRTTTIRDLFYGSTDGSPWQVTAFDEVVERYSREYPEATFSLDRTISGDEAIRNGRVFQLAFEEAVENAVVHSDRDRPRVEITVADGENPHHARVAVADDGPGIPEREWEVIESGTETPLAHSSGLGLWMMYWGVTALGGTVEVSDSEPRGSVVSFEVPLASGGDGGTDGE